MRRARGLTLVELLLVLAAAGVLAAVAWPSWQQQLVKSRRADATAALQGLQAAQAGYHAAHGMYAPDLRSLGGAAAAGSSPQGLYRLALQVGPGELYVATAHPRPDGPQAGDAACATITLRVELGFAERGPSADCWRR